MSRKCIVTMLSLALLFLAGCSTSAPQKPSPGVQNTQQLLKIGVLPIEDNLPFYVAENDKLFEQKGLKVTLVAFPSAKERDAAMQAGQIDGEVADLVAVALLKKGGTDVKVAAVGLGATPQEGRFALLSSPNSKIRTASDLKNAKVAISEHSIIEYVTDQLVKNARLDPTSISKVSIPNIPVRMQMLTASQIDTAVLPDPLATVAEKQGAHVILDDTKIDKNLSQTVILFRQDSISKNKESIRQLVQVYGEAGAALSQNRTKYRPLFLEKKIVPEPLKDTYQAPSFSKLQLPKEADVAAVMAWMVETKLLPQAYNYQELVDSSLL